MLFPYQIEHSLSHSPCQLWLGAPAILYSTADTAADMEKESLNNFYHFLWVEIIIIE